MPKFPSKLKVINSKVKVIILWIWNGNFWIWKGRFCIVCQKWGPWPIWPPVPTSLHFWRNSVSTVGTLCNKSTRNAFLFSVLSRDNHTYYYFLLFCEPLSVFIGEKKTAFGKIWLFGLKPCIMPLQ